MSAGNPLTVTETVLELTPYRRVSVPAATRATGWAPYVAALLAGGTTAAWGSAMILWTVSQINPASSSENNFHPKSFKKISRSMGSFLFGRILRHRAQFAFGNHRRTG